MLNSTSQKGMINADDRAIDWNNPSGDRIPFFHYLVERDYITAVNYLLAKPENSRKYVNLAANGKTALDIVVSHKMETLLRSRGGLYYEELRAQTANTDAKTVSAKIFMDDPVKVKPAQMQPIKGVNDGLEGSNPAAPQGEKGVNDRLEGLNQTTPQGEKEFDGSSMSSIVSVLTDAKRETILTGKAFDECIKECFDDHNKRLMGEFCNKAGLKPHQYNEWDFQSLDELGGMEDVKKQLEENIIDIWRPEVRAALIANKRSLPGGVILEGPPGTGKTTIVETLARQMDVPLYKMSYSQEGNEYIHGVARNVTDIFNRLALEAKIIKKPVMLFFDEAEKFFPRSAERHQVEEVNTYKDLMNTAAASGIILVAATNHINMVNQEITGNPRRMGTIIHVGNPDFSSRVNLFTKLLKDLPILENSLNHSHFEKLASLSEGFSIGNIADTIDKVITQAIKKRINIQPEILMRAFTAKGRI